MVSIVNASLCCFPFFSVSALLLSLNHLPCGVGHNAVSPSSPRDDSLFWLTSHIFKYIYSFIPICLTFVVRLDRYILLYTGRKTRLNFTMKDCVACLNCIYAFLTLSILFWVTPISWDFCCNIVLSVQQSLFCILGCIYLVLFREEVILAEAIRSRFCEGKSDFGRIGSGSKHSMKVLWKYCNSSVWIFNSL